MPEQQYNVVSSLCRESYIDKVKKIITKRKNRLVREYVLKYLTNGLLWIGITKYLGRMLGGNMF